MTWRIEEGDVLERLAEMPEESVHCVITSPPYWGLRDYGTAEWIDGDPECDHLAPLPGGTAASGLGNYDNGLTAEAIAQRVERQRSQYKLVCEKCGAHALIGRSGLSRPRTSTSSGW